MYGSGRTCGVGLSCSSLIDEAHDELKMPPDLWRYFGYDTFHDGDIARVEFDAACRQLYLHVDCPNVKYFASPTSDFEFVTVSFVVHVEDIRTFAFERRNEETSSTVAVPTFLYAEIETAEKEIREADQQTGESHHSIIIDADELRLGCVFRNIHVAGTEPTATTLMLRDTRFKFPLRE